MRTKVRWIALPMVIGALSLPAWAGDDTQQKASDKAKQAATATKETAQEAADKTKQAGRDAGNAITDAWLTLKVKASFWGEEPLDGSDINVDTNNSVVTLKGTVPTAAGRDHAMKLARATDGVTNVVNNLTIGPKADRATARDTKEAVKESGRDARRSAEDRVGTAGQAINDGWITTKIKASYWGDDVLEGSRINVDTANRVVTLKGTVLSAAAKSHAVRIASTTEGVKSVNDQLTVKKP